MKKQRRGLDRYNVLLFEENRGTKTILGNREHRKQFFDFFGTKEQANLFQGKKGTGTPWEGSYICCENLENIW